MWLSSPVAIRDWGKYTKSKLHANKSNGLSPFNVYSFNMAQRCLNKLNMFVVATCISLSSDGAKKLQHYDKNRLLLLEVDICQPDSVAAMQRQIKELLEKSSSYGNYKYCPGIPL